MYQPPNQQPQYPPRPEQYQQSPHYPYQQPQYTPPPMTQPPPPKKSRKKFLALGCGGLVALVVLISIIAAAASAGSGNSPSTASQATQPTPDATQTAASATLTAQPTQAPPTPTAAPTQAPTQSPAQIEAIYKASTSNTTVAALDKDGNNDQYKDVHFTATIASFVKDDSGNTAGANVTDTNYSSFIQVVFPPGTDVSQLNKGDMLEVWGADMGTLSGTNAFGATIQEVGISAVYMTDQTTGYQAS